MTVIDTNARHDRSNGLRSGGAAALCCVVAWSPAVALAQTANRPPAEDPVPRTGAVPETRGVLPADMLLQLPRPNARPYGPVEDPLLYRSQDRTGGIPTRDESVLQLTDNMAQDAARTASVRPTSRTIDDLKTRGFPVLTRTRTDYDPLGIRVPGFTVYPSATVSANATSNVFLQPRGVSDAFATARVAVVARSDFTRHFVDFDGFVEGMGFARSGTENGISYLARAIGRYDVVGRDTLTFDVSRERRLVDRSAVGETITTRSPIRFDRTMADVSGRVVRGRTSFDLRGGVSQVDFQDAQTRAGSPFDEDFRDYTNYGVSVLAAYEVGYGRAFYGSASQDWQRSRIVSTPRRDLQRTEFLAGVRGEVTPLVTGHAALGYLQITFRDPTLRTQRTPAIDVRLDYLYSQLTTFTLSVRRTLLNVSSFTAPGAIVTNTRIGVDHELYRNLILSAGAVYNDAKYLRDNQNARILGGDLAAQYLIDRKWRMRVSIAQRSRRTVRFDTDRGFDLVTTSIGITRQL
jgi:hypothetical protein